MPSTYKTPGVYIEEISTLPASIAQVETAIPAFIGFTKKSKKNGKRLEDNPTRITSLLEFEEYFGTGPSELEITVDLNSDNSVKNVEVGSLFCLYDSVRMFYSNGGGPCYIVSVGDFSSQSNSAYYEALEDGLKTLRKEDEPTLLLFPDAANLFGTIEGTSDKAKLGDLQKAALKQCNDLQDRFCIFDLADGDTELDFEDDNSKTPDLAFRDNIGVQYLKYGASYYPNLRTTLSFDFSYANIKGGLTKNSAAVNLAALSADSTYVDHLELVLDDTDTYSAIADDVPDFSGTDKLDQSPIKEQNVLEGYALIGDKYATASAGKNQIWAKIEYIHFMLESFASMTMVDVEDENLDGDGVTKNDLATKHAEKVDVANSRILDVLKKLYIYDAGYTLKGTASVIADLDPIGVVTKTVENIELNGGTLVYDLTGIEPVLGESIYGSGAPATQKATAEASSGPLQALYEEVVSIYRDFKAEIIIRSENLEQLIKDTNPVYANIFAAINKEGIVLPPSGAIAGVYAATDNERGVWVAPANRSLNGVTGPKVNITADDQAGLNVDVVAGKSINAIRSFTGKGTLIWGARTTAGNSNEWRYVPVRRLFNMVEESVKKATEFVVFEPNDKNTWVRTKAMIENFLNQIWKAGGLAGAKAEHAYIVKVGLGETMTAQDILEGRMIVEIHMAAVRPAEFIILRFMHKLQES